MRSQKETLYYDGSCPLCSAVANSLGEDIEKKDVTKDVLPAHISKEEAMREVHIIDKDGVTHTGVDAVLFIMERNPRRRVLAWLGRLPGFHFLADMLYRLIASERHMLFGTRRQK
jgi:predicted DCC family thiol-disulfide oxidoreductase YuxK